MGIAHHAVCCRSCLTVRSYGRSCLALGTSGRWLPLDCWAPNGIHGGEYSHQDCLRPNYLTPIAIELLQPLNPPARLLTRLGGYRTLGWRLENEGSFPAIARSLSIPPSQEILR